MIFDSSEISTNREYPITKRSLTFCLIITIRLDFPQVFAFYSYSQIFQSIAHHVLNQLLRQWLINRKLHCALREFEILQLVLQCISSFALLWYRIKYHIHTQTNNYEKNNLTSLGCFSFYSQQCARSNERWKTRLCQ